jgi:ribosomal protein S7
MPNSIEVQGLESLASRIKSLPEEGKRQVFEDVSVYGLEVLRQQESQTPKNYVTRAAAYGKPFFTDKQRRYFFAALRDGSIQVPYSRRNRIGNGWSVEIAGDFVIFKNSLSWATYVIGFAGQSRHERMVGWRNIQDYVENKLSFKSSTFRTVVMTAFQKAIRKLNLG